MAAANKPSKEDKRKAAESVQLEAQKYPAAEAAAAAAGAAKAMPKQPAGATPCGDTEALPTFVLEPVERAQKEKQQGKKKDKKKLEEVEPELVALGVLLNADPVEDPDQEEVKEITTYAAIVLEKQVPLVGLEHGETPAEEEDPAAFERRRWVIVEATIFPDFPKHRKKIQWTGGEAVPPEDGKEMPHRRRVSRDKPAHHHIEASLSGKKLFLDIWIMSAELTILTSGTAPKNAVQFGELGSDFYDGTQDLGPKTCKAKNGSIEARGKVVPVAKISPAGVHEAVKTGWRIWRVVQAHVYVDGQPAGAATVGRFGHSDKWWQCPKWVYDSQHTRQQVLVPDEEDKIYDRDAPNCSDMDGRAEMDSEVYYNFVQWVEWGSPNSAGGVCSDWKEWHFHSRWEKDTPQQITFNECAPGHKPLPEDSVLHPSDASSGGHSHG